MKVWAVMFLPRGATFYIEQNEAAATEHSSNEAPMNAVGSVNEGETVLINTYVIFYV